MARWTTYALALIALAGGARAAVSVALSPPCATAAAAFMASLPSCGVTPSVLTNPLEAGACIAPNGLAPLAQCRLSVSQLNTTSDATPTGACALCGSQLVPCQATLTAAIDATLGGALATACGVLPSDVLTLTLLRDQGRITCLGTSPATRQWGVQSLAGLTQCARCGVMACPAGHYCPGGGLAPEICPQGHFCAGGARKETCPEGYYCPQRSAEPLKCRGIAHCPAGSHRENVWVPLFVCLLALVAVVYGLPLSRGVMTGKVVLGWGGGARRAAGDGGGPPVQKAPAAAAPAAVPRISVAFRDLRLVTRGNVRMSGVSGRIGAGRLTAIMGGSGAGKTTLSSLLLGKETPTGGSVAVEVRPPPGGGGGGGEPAFAPFAATVADIQPAVGFVPQVDVMHRELTVRQVVEHSAFTRLPGAWSHAQKRAHAASVLAQMGLAHVADAVVGDEGASGGIAGGEVKRVNVAIELAANPGLLLLDEPTTGLDASSSSRVVQLLRDTARRGVTVVCVIHQPRREVLDMFDDLILLGRGGRSVYQGPMGAVGDYFQQVLGYACPGDTNVSDFVMDVLEARFGAVAPAAGAPTGGEGGDGGKAAGLSLEGEDDDAGASTPPGTGDPDVVSMPVVDAGTPGGFRASSAAELAAAFAATWEREGLAWVAQRRGDQEGAGGSDAAGAASSGGADGTGAPASDTGNGGCWEVVNPMRSPRSAPLAHGPDSGVAASPLPPPTAAALRAVSQPRPSFLAQTLAFTTRALRQHVMAPGFLLDCASLLLGGAVMGIVCVSSSLYIPPVDRAYFNSCPPGAERLCRFQLRVHLAPATFYIGICLGVLCIPVCVRALGTERDVYWREASVGVNRLSYYVGKVLAELPKMALLAFFFVAPLVAISHWRAPVEELYFAVLVDMFFLWALGFCLSAIFVSPDAANLFGVNLSVIMNLFSGFVPLLGNGAVWAYTRHFQRAMLAIELMDGHRLSVDTFNLSMFSKEHENPDWGRDLWALALTALCTYALGFALLRLRHRQKQR